MVARMNMQEVALDAHKAIHGLERYARKHIEPALYESVTRLGDEGVPDDVWDTAQELEPRELADVLVGIATINVWNRIAHPYTGSSGVQGAGRRHPAARRTWC